MANKAKLIVIDGLDGSGKTTQFEMVEKHLLGSGLSVKAISFPEYENPSSALVKMYLNGEFSKNANDINAFAASTFYAVDRYASFKIFWESSYNDPNCVILASRYVSSNAIHQMVKTDSSEWDNFLKWLSDFEYNKLMLPKPDKVIFLDMPIDISQKLLLKRYDGDESKKDIHESNIEYLKSCRKSALYAAEKENWSIIKCNDGDSPLSISEVFDKIMYEINAILV